MSGSPPALPTASLQALLVAASLSWGEAGLAPQASWASAGPPSLSPESSTSVEPKALRGRQGRKEAGTCGKVKSFPALLVASARLSWCQCSHYGQFQGTNASWTGTGNQCTVGQFERACASGLWPPQSHHKPCALLAAACLTQGLS